MVKRLSHLMHIGGSLPVPHWTCIPEVLIADLQAFRQPWIRWRPTAVRLTSVRRKKRKSLKRKAGSCNSLRWGRAFNVFVCVCLSVFSVLLFIYIYICSVFLFFSHLFLSLYCFWLSSLEATSAGTGLTGTSLLASWLRAWTFLEQTCMILRLQIFSFFLSHLQDAVTVPLRQQYLDFGGKMDWHYLFISQCPLCCSWCAQRHWWVCSREWCYGRVGEGGWVINKGLSKSLHSVGVIVSGVFHK